MPREVARDYSHQARESNKSGCDAMVVAALCGAGSAG
jgi:hypothetical protein